MGKVLVEFAVFTSVLFSQTSQPSRLPPHLSMNVLLYDHARVAEGKLAQAEQTVIRIFAEAGIEVKPLECASPYAPDHTVPACLRPLEPTDLVVRIEPGVRPDAKLTLGFSQGATYASIYYQRAVEFAADQLAPEVEILGCGISHEIGHLLLQTVEHSARGIMRAEWSKEELKLMNIRNLHFSPQEARAMRSEVERRTNAGTSALR
jgi:hypothetical protein